MVNFKQLLEKATTSESTEPDWETILEIVEEVKTKNVSAKNAIKEFRRRLLDNNGNVVYLCLLVLESLMKNCASEVHAEVLTTEFLGIIKALITSSKDGKSEKAVDKALELIGEWKSAFGQQSGYKAVNTVFAELEREGYHIPVTPVASAAFIKKAPDWELTDRCFMCRQEFNRFKGKLRHHCRNCGKSVCAQCSGKRAALPHFGVEEPTRVCDICFKKVEKGEGASAAAESDLPVEYLKSSLAQESQVPVQTGSSSTEQTQEEDDLQLAIAMSLNEQENKKKTTSSIAPPPPPPSSSPTPRSTTPSAPPPPATSTLYATIMHPEPQSRRSASPHSHQQEPDTSDPLARYLDRNYWEQRKEQQASGASPPASADPAKAVGPEAAVLVKGASSGGGTSPLAESVRNTINMFVKRIHDVSSSHGSIAADPVVLSLFQNLSAMQPQLLKQLDDLQQQKAKQQDILNKLNEAKEARVTLNRMRREHQDKVKQMEQEQAMLARMQMEQKLALLRQQKQEQLEFQKSLQQKRLEVLNTQRAEFEQKVAMQREMERQQLILQEQKVLQHQFGADTGGSPQPIRKPLATGMGGPPLPPAQVTTQQFQLQHQQQPDIPPPPVPVEQQHSIALQSLSLHDHTSQQALPLPPKLDYSHTPPLDTIAPPPYNPGPPLVGGDGTGGASGGLYGASFQSLPAQQTPVYGGALEPSNVSSFYELTSSAEPSLNLTSGQFTGLPPTTSIQPSSGFQQQPSGGFSQPSNGFQPQGQPSSGFQQQPPQGQPSSGFQQQPPQGPPSSGFQQQPPQGPPSGGFQQQPPHGPPSGGFQQQPPQGQPSGGFQQQPPHGPPSGGFQQQPPQGQPSSGFQQQPPQGQPSGFQQQPSQGQPSSGFSQQPPQGQVGVGNYGGTQQQQFQYQEPLQQQQQQQPPPQGYGYQYAGGAGGQPLHRQESEPPLISFD